MTAMTPELSVVIPTHKRPDLLARLLASLGRQTVSLDRFEVCVIDDGSGEPTRRLLERSELPNLKFRSFDEGSGPAAARNRGVELAGCALILFLDDDVEAFPDLVETHLRLQAGDPKLGVLGRVDWHPDLEITPFMRWLDRTGLQFAYDTWLEPGPVDPPYAALYTANLSMHRELLGSVGGFDERFPYPAYEDMELGWRLHDAGFHMDYRPEARVYHTRGMDLEGFAARMAKVAESAVLLGAVQPDFPLDASHTPERWTIPPRWRRWLLRLRARLTPDLLEPHYRAEIAAAYRTGLERGRARLVERTRPQP